MDNRAELIEKIFSAQDKNGFWKTLTPNDRYYPDYQHYVPNFKASLWTLILLADLQADKNEVRVRKSLTEIKDQFYDADQGIFTLKEDHFPIPCLNGNIIYLDAYFNEKPDPRCIQALEFFAQYQRFDDGCYEEPKNKFCANTSCYGTHSCYWGIVKLLKGISFVPKTFRSQNVQVLKQSV
ncbi:MAG: hypothetical protein IPH36_14435 [Saprospiraceae bacterium]|nr:hypothetical protein [Saprospiraceae bacterium]